MSVKVAVRVRPFNQREIDLGTECCIDMNGPKTQMIDHKDPKKNRDFSFDFSFWSHDGFEIQEDGMSVPTDKRYADQRDVYDKVGVQILDNAWQGYHCCLFAYGQTGSGKSYSMVGYKPNKGIVPIACEEIFKRIDKDKTDQKSFEVSVSMLEIYMEKVQDLLIIPSKRPQGGLKIRESQNLGFYCENLTKHAVENYQAIESKMDEGTKHRTTASTLMNSCSSRAHTIITIEFKQIEQTTTKKNEKFSCINLVDLAGSEKVGKTGATGDRLGEAGMINKSLSMLGRVIQALADLEQGKKGVKVPYRDSCLTKILMNALGGNSKTLMICAVSPAQDNWDETLSTLRYADQAKKIKNRATVNESATDKIIRELNEQNDRLKKFLAKFNFLGIDLNDTGSLNSYLDMEDKQIQLSSNEKALHQMNMTHQEKLQIARENQEEEKLEVIDTTKPYLSNLNEDPILNSKIKYSLAGDEILVGRKNGNPTPQIILGGMGIKQNHCQFKVIEQELYLNPIDKENGDFLFLNGDKVFERTQCFNNDRVIFGTNSTFLIMIPDGKDRETQETIPKEIDWEFAQSELEKKAEEEKKEIENEIEQQLEVEMAKKMNQFEEQMKKEMDQRESKKQQQEEEFQKKIIELEKQMKEKEEQTKIEEERKKIEEEHVKKQEAIQMEIQQQEQKKESALKKIEDEEKKKKNLIKQKHYTENKLTKNLPKICEVNLIAKQFEKNVTMTAKVNGNEDINPKELSPTKASQMNIHIQVKNEDVGSVYYWDLQKFSNRYYIIKDLLDRYFETNEVPKIPQEEDPFWDPPENHIISVGNLKLMSLCYVMDNPAEIKLIGEENSVGSLNTNLVPTDEEGIKNLSEQIEEEDAYPVPEDLLGKRLDFFLMIEQARLPKDQCKDTYVEYQLMDPEFKKLQTFKTNKVLGKEDNPFYNYKQQHTFENINEDILKYLQNESIVLKVYGLHETQQLYRNVINHNVNDLVAKRTQTFNDRTKTQQEFTQKQQKVDYIQSEHTAPVNKSPRKQMVQYPQVKQVQTTDDILRKKNVNKRPDRSYSVTNEVREGDINKYKKDKDCNIF